jgi:hypothetical protein
MPVAASPKPQKGDKSNKSNNRQQIGPLPFSSEEIGPFPFLVRRGGAPVSMGCGSGILKRVAG